MIYSFKAFKLFRSFFFLNELNTVFLAARGPGKRQIKANVALLTMPMITGDDDDDDDDEFIGALQLPSIFNRTGAVINIIIVTNEF